MLIAALGLLVLPPLLLALGLTMTSATEVVIFALACMALNILVGHTGLVSFGHGAWFGLAAYAAALLQRNLMPDSFFGPTIAGVLIVTAIAAAFGFLILRRRGVYFSLLTLALAAMLYAVAFRWTDVTGGENGLGGITRPTLFGFNLESSTNYYWFVAAIAFLVLILLWRFHNSTVGSVLVAIRENEQRARFLGYPTNRYKLAAFVLSAGDHRACRHPAAVQNRMTSADPISVAFSGDLLAMVVIGGMRSFLGPALGALFFILFREFLRHLHRELAVLVRPGVRRLHRVFADRPGRRRRAADRAVPQEDDRRCRDVGAPHRSAAAAGIPAAEIPHRRAGACRPATSSRASAASRPCRASTSPSQTARCTR